MRRRAFPRARGPITGLPRAGPLGSARLLLAPRRATRPPGALPKSSGRRLGPAASRATEVADSVRGARPGEGARVGKRPDPADYGGAPRVSLAPSVTGGAGRPAEYVGTVNADSALDTARRGAYINSSRSNARRRKTAARRGRARDLENRILRSRDRRRRQTSEVESSLGMS